MIPFLVLKQFFAVKKSAFVFALLAVASFSFHVAIASAQELVPEKQETVKARVLEASPSLMRALPGTMVDVPYQTLSAEILEGARAGSLVTFENDFTQLESGDLFYLSRTTHFDGTERYAVGEPYRLHVLGFFALLFLAVILLFGKSQGARGLLSLGVSLLVLYYVLFPSLVSGHSPVVVALLSVVLMVVLGSYITHGWNKTTHVAVAGMLITLLVTGVLAYGAVESGNLSGFESEEAVYLNFDTAGVIDFRALLLGGILIGLLGVLYDAAIGQAVAVEELASVGAHLSRREILERALRIGREHIGALVDTLAIAYVGAALPLLLLFYSSDAEVLMTLNREIFAVEITRILIGSIGVILAVPITTHVAVRMLVQEKIQD